MKRIKKFIILLMIVVLSTSIIPITYAEEIVFDEEYGFNVSYRNYPWQTLTFYSNYTNMFYVFFNSDRTGSDRTYYSWSYDGISWSDKIEFSVLGISTGDLEFYLEPNGRYIHYARIYFPSSPNQIWYGKLELLMNGSIVFPTGLSNQIVLTTTLIASMEAYDSIDIIVDNESRPYIACTVRASGSEWAYLFRSYQTDGTWVTDSFESWRSEDLIGNQIDDDYYTALTTVGDGVTETGIGRGVQWMLFWDCKSLAGDQITGTSLKNYFDGAGWSSAGLGGTQIVDHEGGDWGIRQWDLATVGNITILFKTNEHLAGPDRIKLDCIKRIGTDAWISQQVVSFEVLGDAGAVEFQPMVAIDYNRSVLFVWTIRHPDNSTVWYRKGQMHYNGTITWYTDVIEWEDWDNLGTWEYYNIGNGFDVLPDNVPMSMAYSDEVSDFIYHDYLFTEGGGELDLPAKHYNTTLYNSDGSINDGWIFRGETYKFESYFEGASTFELNFTDGEHNIEFIYINETQRLSINVNDQFVIGDYYFNITHYPNDITKAIWGFIPNTNIVDIENTTVYYNIYNEESDYTVSGSTGIQFNIYNLGGYTYYSFNGDGGKTAYGTSAFDLHATNGSENSWARAEQIFRKLQHISFLIEIDMDNEWESGNGKFDIDAGIGYVDIGFDYRLNGSWIEGYKIKIYVQSANVGHHNAGIDHDWIEWKVDFYNYNPATGNQQHLQSQLIYSNHWGYEHENYVPDYHNRTSSQLWIDLWFDRTNASTTIASQVNAYYHGIKEQGSSWWFGYGTFVPMISEYDNAKFIDDLYDEGGNITNCQKYDLIKFYIKVGKVYDADGDDEIWRIRAIEDMHREQAIDRMGGIDEPTFVETKVLDMPQTGFINAIKSALGNIANSITQGIFFTLKSLWAGVGWIAELMGLKQWYDALSVMIENISSASLKFMDELETALINSALLLEQIFRLISSGLIKWTSTLTLAITSIISWYTYIVQMFTGGGLWSINIWMSLSLEDWFGLFITLLPVWWINRLAYADDLLRTFQGDISFAIMLITGLFNFLASVIMLSVALLNFILGLLPI